MTTNRSSSLAEDLSLNTASAQLTPITSKKQSREIYRHVRIYKTSTSGSPFYCDSSDCNNEWTTCHCPLISHVAVVRIFTCVRPQMIGQTVTLGERFIAHVTFVRFFTSVHPLVFDQIALLRERLVAHVTFVRIFTCVRPQTAGDRSNC
ncbi:uncharacterized protein LOC113555136 [Rhopalosiphum maidis]|uniref:uncharacterized protein LOC113555136 n=1 Tax=Rhopalosiphum maidis TaxID=43146 RepID=UPI000EFDCD4D|nr:uncharacterized protein LOC113555136 [Rhopalosiphum maidis]